MRDAADTDGPHSINEQRVRSVEGIDITEAIRKACPARGLYGSANLQREFIEAQFPSASIEFAFQDKAAQLTIGRQVIKTMIVDPHVREMLRHAIHGVFATRCE